MFLPHSFKRHKSFGAYDWNQSSRNELVFYLGNRLGLKVKSLWLHVQHSPSSDCRLPSAVTYPTLRNSATVRPSGLRYPPLQQGDCQQTPPPLPQIHAALSQLRTRPTLRVTHTNPCVSNVQGWIYTHDTNTQFIAQLMSHDRGVMVLATAQNSHSFR